MISPNSFDPKWGNEHEHVKPSSTSVAMVATQPPNPAQ